MNPDESTKSEAPQKPTSPRASGVQIARLGGVPVFLDPTWLLLAAVLVYLYAPVTLRLTPEVGAVGSYLWSSAFVVCLLASVLLHELGHALVARGYGIGVRSITLNLLGGYTQMEGDSPHPRADLLVSAIGPIVSGVLGVGALGLEHVLPPGTVYHQLAFQLAWSNIVVAVFNALPGLPLDGGRALRALVWGATGDRNAGTIAAGWIGRLVAIAAVVVGAVLSYLNVVGAFSFIIAALIALTMWRGAGAAIAYGKLASRIPKANLRQLARPVYLVFSGTPLSEAIRRVTETGLPGVVLAVADSAGTVVALVNEAAAAAVPVERRPWVPVDSVARTLEPGRRLPVELAGADLIKAVQAHPAPHYLVTAGNDVVGVLQTTDLARLLNS